MQLARKTYQTFDNWRVTKTKQALLVTGARQVGKTHLIRQFAHDHWDNVIEINLFENDDAREAIGNARNSNELFMRISTFSDVPLEPGKTVVFLDEIQEIEDPLTPIKFLMERKDVDYILSGSMLGVELKNIASAPVGYLHTVKMYPLDFEEYCWANGVSPDVLAHARAQCETGSSIDEFVHRRLSQLFHRYLISGGMPDAVVAFVGSDDVNAARVQQEAIVTQYRYDISKYAGDRARVVRRIFDLMPSEISRQDKRFTVRDVEGDSHFNRYDNDFLWLADANVALPVYNVNEPRYPLATSEDSSKFKLFSSDVGLLTYQCGMDVVRDIVNERPDINFGALHENFVAQELAAHGVQLHYYKDRVVGELDFVMPWHHSRVLPIEVKSGKAYKRHSALTKSLRVENWGIEEALVLREGNVEQAGSIRYLPTYAAAWL